MGAVLSASWASAGAWVQAEKRGRNPVFSGATVQFFLSIKCLFGQALRQSLGMVQSLRKLAGLDWPAPEYNTVCRRPKWRL